jgi:hypothetical protein
MEFEVFLGHIYPLDAGRGDQLVYSRYILLRVEVYCAAMDINVSYNNQNK